MSFSVAPTGNQTLSMREIDQMLQEARGVARTGNPRVSGLRMIEMMRSKNNGYPKWFYHATQEARLVTKEEEEVVLLANGYQEQYIPRAYPKVIFRRNMDPKFEPKFDPATQIQVNHDFVEERTVRSEQQERALMAMKPKQGQSQWFESLDELNAQAPIEEGPTEDPKVTIARLQGQLAALAPQDGEAVPVRRGPGRPRKEETAPEA